MDAARKCTRAPSGLLICISECTAFVCDYTECLKMKGFVLAVNMNSLSVFPSVFMRCPCFFHSSLSACLPLIMDQDSVNKARVGTCVNACVCGAASGVGCQTPTCASFSENPNLRGINESTCSARAARGSGTHCVLVPGPSHDFFVSPLESSVI